MPSSSHRAPSSLRARPLPSSSAPHSTPPLTWLEGATDDVSCRQGRDPTGMNSRYQPHPSSSPWSTPLLPMAALASFLPSHAHGRDLDLVEDEGNRRTTYQNLLSPKLKQSSMPNRHISSINSRVQLLLCGRSWWNKVDKIETEHSQFPSMPISKGVFFWWWKFLQCHISYFMECRKRF
jgi:hypothetical protein